MMNIPLSAVPNQSFSITLDGNEWDFTVKTTNGQTSVSITLNGVDIVDNARAVANGFILSSQYEEAGNFFILTQNFQLPIYTQFGTDQYLIYVNAVELAAFRLPKPTPITAADFNPIAALPLRFSPQGYT